MQSIGLSVCILAALSLVDCLPIEPLTKGDNTTMVEDSKKAAQNVVTEAKEQALQAAPAGQPGVALAAPVPPALQYKPLDVAERPKGLQTGYMALDLWPDEMRRNLVAAASPSGVHPLEFEKAAETNQDWMDAGMANVEKKLQDEASALLAKERAESVRLKLQILKDLLGVTDVRTVKFMDQVAMVTSPPIDGYITLEDKKELDMLRNAAEGELAYNLRVEDLTHKELTRILGAVNNAMAALTLLNNSSFTLKIKHSLDILETMMPLLYKEVQAYAEVLASEVSAPLAFTKVPSDLEVGETDVPIGSTAGFMEGQTLTICPNCPNEERLRIGRVSTGEPPSSLSLVAVAASKQSITLATPLAFKHVSGEMIVQGVFQQQESSTSTEESLEFNSDTPKTPVFTNMTIRELRLSAKSTLVVPKPPMQSLSLPILSKHAKDIVFLLEQLRNKTLELVPALTIEQAITTQQEANERVKCEWAKLVGTAFNSSIEGAMEDAVELRDNKLNNMAVLPDLPSHVGNFSASLPTGASVQFKSAATSAASLASAELVTTEPTPKEKSTKPHVAVNVPDVELQPTASSSQKPQTAIPKSGRIRASSSEQLTELMQLSGRTSEMGVVTELMALPLPSPPAYLADIGIEKIDENLYNASFEDNAYEKSMDALETHMSDWVSVQNDFPKAHARVEAIISQLNKIKKDKETELHLVSTLSIGQSALQAKFKQAALAVSNKTTIVDRPKDAQNMPTNPWLEQWTPGCNPGEDGCTNSILPSPTPLPWIKRKTITFKDRRTGAIKKRFGSINDAMNDVGGEEVIAPPPDISQLFSQLGSNKAQVAKGVMAEATHLISSSGDASVDSMPESKNSKPPTNKDIYNPNVRVSKVFHKHTFSS